MFDRVEHDEAAYGVEGEPEGAEGVAAEYDGRALLRAREQVCGDAAKDERADADGRGAYAARMDFAARYVARARAAPAFSSDYAEGARGRFVHGEAEARARVQERAPAFAEHHEGASALSFREPRDDRALGRRLACAEWARARVEEA